MNHKIISTIIPLAACILIVTHRINAQVKTANNQNIEVTALDAFMQSQMIKHEVPGLSFALINEGKLAYHQAYGIKNLKRKAPVDKNTLFEAASISKSVFAYFAMMMVEEGLINLDTPLYKYMPEVLIADDSRYKLITARMVLSHTSGLPNWRFFNEDGKLDIKFEPGTRFFYSGEGYEYLARVLAHLHHTDYDGLDAIIKKKMYEPLNMASSGFRIPEEHLKQRKADGYEDGVSNEGIPADLAKPYFGASFKFHTNNVDFAQFMMALINQKGLGKAFFDEMFAEQVKLPEDESLRIENGFDAWGLGFIRTASPYGIKLAHGGMNPSFQCYFMVLRDKKFGFAFFGNSNTAINMVPAIEQYLLSNSIE